MYCKKCGTEIVEGAKFCPKCGISAENQLAAEPGASAASVSQPARGAIQASGIAPEADLEPPQKADATPPVKDAATEPEQGSAPSAKRARRAPLAVAAVAAAVIIGVGTAAGLGWKADQDAQASMQAAWELTHTSLVTQVVAQTPGFDDSATAIPVQINGTDLDGNVVDEIQYLRPSSMEITTLPGSYDVTFPGGYFTGEGTVVKAPEGTVHIELPAPTTQEEAEQTNMIPPQSVDEDVYPAESLDEGSPDVAAEDVPSGQSDDKDSAGGAHADGAESAPSADSAASAASSAASTASDAPQSAEAAEAADASSASADSASAKDADATADAAAAAEGAVGQAGGSAPGSLSVLQSITFTEVPELEVTDELIDEIAKWASEDDQNSGKAVELQQAAATRHAQAVEAEEARKAEEEAAAAQARAEETAQAAAREEAAESAATQAEAAQTTANNEAEAAAAAAAAEAAAADAAAQAAQQEQQYYTDQRQQMAVG